MPPRLLPIAGKAGATMVCSNADRNIASMMPATMARIVAWSSGAAGASSGCCGLVCRSGCCARPRGDGRASPTMSGAMPWASSGAISRVMPGIPWPAPRRNATGPLRRADAQFATPAAHRDAGGVDGLGIAGHQRVPPVQVLALGEQHIGAGRRQPGDGFEVFGREPHAVVDLFQPMPVVAAAAGLAVEQPAAHAGVIGAVGRLFLELVEAAFAAAVAEAFPFGIRHFLQ